MMATKNEIGGAVALLRSEFPDMPVMEKPQLDVWLHALMPFADGIVKRAAESFVKSSKFKPHLADIIELCTAQSDGNWLGADEAWALMPKSESESAMLTEEIAQAFSAAAPLLADGEKNAARMAFRDAYNRLTEQAKIAGRQPVYFPSWGSDKGAHVSMLANAVKRGQISIGRALEALPQHAPELVQMAGIKNHPLLAPPDEAAKLKVKALLLTLKSPK